MSAPVTNLLRAHWAEARGFSFDLAFQRASEHFTIEHAEADA